MNNIKALTFDTGGTILDWHSGFKEAFRMIGKRYNYFQDWEFLANELRRRSLKSMLNLGENETPKYNFDDAHKFILLELINEHNLTKFTEKDINYIAYEAPHNFKCWSDFPETLPKLREMHIVCSFTILSYRIIIDTAQKMALRGMPFFHVRALKNINYSRKLIKQWRRTFNWNQSSA